MNDGKRKLIYGANMAVMIVLVLAILGAVNWLATKHYKRWDPTESADEALSPQTVNVLKSLDKDVKVTHFHSEAYEQMDAQALDQYKALLEKYKAVSGKFSYEIIDYRKNPVRVEEFIKKAKEINLQDKDSVVQYGDRIEKISSMDESALTQAIIKVTSGGERTVCFTEGHGEHDPDLSDVGGYGNVSKLLQAENYAVKKINIALSGIPEACTIVVVAGPLTPFNEEEAQRLKKRVDAGGKLMVMLEPTGVTGLEALIKEYGVVAEDNVLKLDEADSVGIDKMDVISEDYDPSHPITADLSNKQVLTSAGIRPMPMRMFSARSLKLDSPAPAGVETTQLITTYEMYKAYSAAAIAPSGIRRHLEGEGESAGKALTDAQPFPVAVAALKAVSAETPQSTDEAQSGKKPSVRVVVFGDSDWVSDGYIQDGSNSDVFMNSIAWLAVEESSIGIRPKENKAVPIHFGGTDNWLKLALILLLVPGALIINAILVWREKKRM